MKSKIRFLPLLFIYLMIILFFYDTNYQQDESRYVMFATNLAHGYYSPPGTAYLWSGPGYPIVLLPFVLLKLPLLTAKIFNAIFMFLAVIYFYNTLRFYMQERPAFLFSYLIGMYPPFFKNLPLMHTETFCIFLVCGFIYHFCKLHCIGKDSKTQYIIASFYLGYLALTKVIFGYGILCVLILSVGFFLWKKKSYLKLTISIYFLALVFCLPYLFYTYSLTGQVFYWTNAGGENLYWMSSPNENELGNWNSPRYVRENGELLKEHLEFYNELENLSSIERDYELKRRAIRNIITYPSKYFKNWLANIGRLLFNYPYSYTYQKLSSYYYFIPNMFFNVFIILCIYLSFRGRRLIPCEIYNILLFALIVFMGSSIVSAYNRMFYPLVPFFALWMSFVLSNIVKIEIRQLKI